MACKRFIANTCGTVQVVAGIFIAVMMLAIATGLTFADGFSIRSQAQEALDAAVVAGASAPNSFTDEQIIALAQVVYEQNRNKRAAESADIDVLSRASTTFKVSATTVVGELKFDLRSPFLGVLGRDSMSIGVQSGAKRAFGAPICVLGLDQNQAATIDMNGRASIDLENCAAMANSSNGQGINQIGNAGMRALDIGVHGGYSGSNYTPVPTAGLDPILDPLASLPLPAPGACHPDSGARLAQETRTLTPGTFCGGITVASSSVVTLQPGIYIMKDGTFRINSQASVSGREVMIAFVGPDATLEIYSGGALDVTSPTMGTYANIQFFGDRRTYLNIGNGSTLPPGQDNGHLWFTVIGDSRLTYDGVVYLPMHHIWWAGGSIVRGSSPNYAAIAKKLWFQDNTQVQLTKENRRNLNVDGPASLMRAAVLFR
jgi:hypothetical protein